MGFSMNRPNMSISYGGESNKQQKSNLMKDNPVAKHASAMNMGKAHSKSPNYKYSDTPMELTAEGKKKILASDANPEFKKAIAKSPVNKNDPKKTAKLASVEQKPKGNVKGLKKKKTIKSKPKAQQSIHRYIEQKENGKVIKTIGTKPGSPATKKGEPKRVKIESKGKAGQGSTEYIRGGRDGDKNARSVEIGKDYSGKQTKTVRRKKKDGTIKTKSKKISDKKAERIKKRKDKTHGSESPVKNITCGSKKYKK